MSERNSTGTRGEPTWWDVIDDLHAAIQFEKTSSPKLYQAVVALRDRLNDWLAEMDSRRAR